MATALSGVEELVCSESHYLRYDRVEKRDPTQNTPLLAALVPHPSITVVAWVENAGCARPRATESPESHREPQRATESHRELQRARSQLRACETRAREGKVLKSAVHIGVGFKLSPVRLHAPRCTVNATLPGSFGGVANREPSD